MSPAPAPAQLVISQLLDCWNLITGQSVRMIPAVERALFEFQKLYSKADLESTLNFIVHQNRKSDKPWHLRFGKFFDSDFTHFESLRAEAEQHDKAQAARKRAFKPSAGESALAEMRREEVKPVERGPVVARDVLLKNLSELKTKIEQQ